MMVICFQTNFLAPSISVINEMSVLSPLNVKRFDKYTLYINHTHLIHFFYTFQFVSILFVKIKISFSLKLKT